MLNDMDSPYRFCVKDGDIDNEDNHSTSGSQSSESTYLSSSDLNILKQSYISEEEYFQLYLALIMLYRDRIRPELIEIQWRLQALHCSSYLQKHALSLYISDSELYEVICDKSQGFTIYMVYLKNTPEWFEGWIDICTVEEDPFRLNIWVEFYSYILGLQMSNTNFNCFQMPIRYPSITNKVSTQTYMAFSKKLLSHYDFSKYSKDQNSIQLLKNKKARFCFSCFLKVNGPEAIRKFAVGSICQIIHLAVLYGILVYEENTLLPLASSILYNEKYLNKKSLHAGDREQISNNISIAENTHRASHIKTDECINTSDKNHFSQYVQVDKNCSTRSQSSVMTNLSEIHEALGKLMSHKEWQPMLLSQFKLRFYDMFHKHLDPLVFECTSLSSFLRTKCFECCQLRQSGRHMYIERVDNHTKETVQIHCDNLKMANTADELIRIVSKHYRFHSNLTFAFWQDSFLKKKNVSHSNYLDESAAFLDSLFGNILRPALDVQKFQTNKLIPTSSDIQFYQLKWFTRLSFLERKLAQSLKLPLNDPEQQILHTSACSIFFLSWFQQNDSENSIQSFSGISKPSKLRRQITTEFQKLNKTIFETSGL